MEFSAVNRRRPSHETPLGPGAKKDSCFRRLHIRLLFPVLQSGTFTAEVPGFRAIAEMGKDECKIDVLS